MTRFGRETPERQSRPRPRGLFYPRVVAAVKAWTVQQAREGGAQRPSLRRVPARGGCVCRLRGADDGLLPHAHGGA